MALPVFLLDRLQAQYGAETANRILDGYAVQRAVTLRANTLRATAVQVADALRRADIGFDTVPWSDTAFLLRDVREEAVRRLPLYEEGDVYLQSLSSMLPPVVLAPAEGCDILDMTAAPGSKTTQMAALTGNRAFITACERDPVRAERLRYNLQKQGATRVSVLVADARKLDSFLSYDSILLDAPCSGSGTLSLSNEKGLQAFSEALVRNSAKLQTALLAKALSLLKPGHEMVYSTCSILAEENENVVKRVIGGVAEVVPIAFDGMDELPLLPTAIPGALCVCPTERYEGFFLVKLRKKKK